MTHAGPLPHWQVPEVQLSASAGLQGPAEPH
jgi:hypothetical protein